MSSEEKITLMCNACGNGNSKKPKAAPVNSKEAKQILFICDHCGAKTLRDGTILGIKPEDRPVEIPNEEGRNWIWILGIIFAAIVVFVGKNQSNDGWQKPQKTDYDPFNYLR